MKPQKIIGILGGAGPLATANFFADIINICQTKYNAEQDTDFPIIYLYNMPMDGFDETGFADPELVKQQLVNGVKKLEEWGADFIVLPCNTIHYFVSEMRHAISIPIISIVESTITTVQKTGYNKIGVLSSASTRILELYKKPFEQLGLDVYTPSNADQEQTDAVVLSAMAGSQGDTEKDILTSIMQKMVASGAQGVILGCTELPLAISQADTHIPLFNTIHILAEYATDEAYRKSPE
jgi:aspartate racemase